MNFDVIIIGAGLAGLNAAYNLLQNNKLKICIISPHRSKKNNPARLTFTDVLVNYDIDDCAICYYNSFGLKSYLGTSYIHHFEKPTFVSLDYIKACSKIEQKIINHYLFKRIFDRVIDIQLEDNAVKIHISSGALFTAKFLLDASGKTHLSNKIMLKQSPILYSHNYGLYFTNTRNKNPDEAFFIAPSLNYGSGGGWFYPYGKDKASVGFALVADSPKYPAGEIKEKFKRAITEIDFLNISLKKARPTIYELGTIPIEPQSNIAFDRILVVGDAAGQATPWTCMGVEPALVNSDLASRILIQAFNKNEYNISDLLVYQHEWNLLNEKTYNHVTQFDPKIWFAGDAVWDFIIEKDIGCLTAQQFYERVRYNEHLMSKWTSLFKWGQFRLKHLRDWTKYKN